MEGLTIGTVSCRFEGRKHKLVVQYVPTNEYESLIREPAFSETVCTQVRKVYDIPYTKHIEIRYDTRPVLNTDAPDVVRIVDQKSGRQETIVVFVRVF